MNIRLLLTAAFGLCTQLIVAQARTITGTVKDKSTGEALPGVAVVVESTSKGGFTDVAGKYSLEIPDNNAVVIFNMVGYAQQKISAGAQTVIDVMLEADAETEEVVITALGVPRDKKALGYAAQKVEGSELNTAKETNLINSMQGKVAGVQISGSSNLGGSSRILIRGAKSLTGENQPLIIVDGVPVNNGNFATRDQARGALGYDYGNAAQDINSADIENVQVLRGSAAALYGSRGANGVILITTKKGKAASGKGRLPIGVSFNQTYGFDKVFVLPDYQNLYGGGPSTEFDSSITFPGLLMPRYNYDGSWGPKFEGQQVLPWYAFDEKYHPEQYGKTVPWEAQPDNVKDFFVTGQTSNTNVALDGANATSNFRLSLSNLNQKGTIVNSQVKRNTVSFGAGHSFSDRFGVSIGANYVQTKGKGRPATGYSNIASNFTQWWQRQINMSDLEEYKNPDGSQRSWNRYDEFDASPLYWDNPYWTQYENFETDQRDRLYGNVAMNYKLRNNLNLVGTVMTDLYSDGRQERTAVGSVTSPVKYSEDRINFFENNFELKLLHKANINKVHDFNTLVGLNKRDTQTDRIYQESQGGLNIPNFYSLENSVDPILIDPNKSQKVVNSAFASVSYGYKNFLYFDLTGRNDWSSTLPDGNNSYFYPSASSSLIFSNLIDFKAMSFGKVRLSWSKVGNDTDPYRLETRPSPGQGYEGMGVYYLPATINNPNLKPEQVRTFEVGTEMNFFVDRIGFDFTYYNTQTTDNIFRIQQSGASGSSFRFTNAGTMENKGIEISANFIPVRTKQGLEVGVGFNFARNRNEVVELYADENGNEVTSLRLETAPFATFIEARPGEAYGQIVGYDFAYDASGNKIIDPNTGFYERTSTVVPLGSVLADFTGGVSLWASYKGFKVYTLFDFQKGGKLFSMTNMWGKYSGTLEETAVDGIRENGVDVTGAALTGYDEEGNPLSSGEIVTVNVAAVDHFFGNQGYIIGAADVYDASYIKFRELRITYDFMPKMLEKTPFQGLSVGVTGRNLAILMKNVPHIDPESAISTGNVQGIEGGQLPTARNISFLLSVRF
ncbi:MAG: SusC/RagA family TonB-linked outer membrane protein [Flavobacteriales bacterium]